MRIVFLLPLLALLFTACTKEPDVTVEEQVVMRGFVNFISGVTYEGFCNKTDPKSYYDFKKKENVMLIGNQQLLAGYLGGLHHIRFPEKSMEDGIKWLTGIQNNVEAKMAAQLQKEGCKSEAAQTAAKAFQLYRHAHPAQIAGLMHKEIEKNGGKVTPLKDIEEAGGKTSAPADTKTKETK